MSAGKSWKRKKKNFYRIKNPDSLLISGFPLLLPEKEGEKMQSIQAQKCTLQQGAAMECGRKTWK